MASRKKPDTTRVIVEGEPVEDRPSEVEETVSSEASFKRVLHCVADGKQFRVTIPENAKVTFAPWAPGGERSERYVAGGSRGTLRVYKTSAPNSSIIFIKSGVTEFRELDSVEYEEATEEVVGKRVWKSDRHGYTLHEEVKHTPNSNWETTPDRQLPEGTHVVADEPL